MISTVLFFDEVPVGYLVEQLDDKVRFTPSIFTRIKLNAPAFSLIYEEGSWNIRPQLDKILEHQVLTTMTEFEMGALIKNFKSNRGKELVG